MMIVVRFPTKTVEYDDDDDYNIDANERLKVLRNSIDFIAVYGQLQQQTQLKMAKRDAQRRGRLVGHENVSSTKNIQLPQ